ncbi:MAG: tRNA (N6-threonylcarbamoyladenosine(37)-N6)-methyltransferase TrmO [Bacteroidales bacterium]|nr:tRNA (N6-threonylcarbamoyladenosine(37)-N6)-methyltransferase TrmO [Bacteroidales bacterium]
MDKITFFPIGTIYTPFEKKDNMPIQPNSAKNIKGKIVVNEEFSNGLKDLDGFSHIILIYNFHLSNEYSLNVIPFLDTEPRGLFSTRAPKRPNQIGMSIVKLDKIENNILFVSDIDVINKTPLLDIKPYVPDFDAPKNTKTGWYSKHGKKSSSKLSDNRFQ